MKKLLTFMVVCLATLVMCGCATAPSATQVQLITEACTADALARPIAQAACAVSCTPAESFGLTTLENAIDQVCQSPASSAQQNALDTLQANKTQVAQLVSNLTARQAGKPIPYPTLFAGKTTAMPTTSSPTATVTAPTPAPISPH